jgi:TatD DNase family protein
LLYVYPNMFDTHAHLTDPHFSEDQRQVISSAFVSGVTGIITISTNETNSLECIQLTKKYKNIYATAGVHPHEASAWNQSSQHSIESCAAHIIAIGEIGLDYHYNYSPGQIQKTVFKQQLNLAVHLLKPVIIHCRNAFDDLKEILEPYPPGKPGGVIHCFTGNTKDADFFLKKGFYMSFGGMLTFANSSALITAARHIPIDRILLETDSPYLSPHPHRGKRNTPQNIHHIYRKYAEIVQIDINQVQKIVRDNVRRCFGM